ncbi:MAG: cyclic nucleotide-binding domain-containing protein [Leptospiraceae bacterium]|nr:cyclic nucleotide-binding domain-containing protein [Leptospiraceae bacterium]
MIIVFFSKNEFKKELIQKTLQTNQTADLEFISITNPSETISFLEYRMPEFAIFDLDDEDFSKLENLTTIFEDSWLSSAGILGITEDKTNEIGFSFPFLYIFHVGEIQSQLNRMLTVLLKNENLLFRSGIIQEMGSKGNFVIMSDIDEVKPYAELIASSLYNRGLILAQKKYGIIFALNELLVNAIEHGNCEISFKEKQEWLEKNKRIVDLIAIKKQDPEISNRVVQLEYELLIDRVRVMITDMGKGFDYESNLKAELNQNFGASGRGILMTKYFTHSLSYYPPGNKVELEILYDNFEPVKLPKAFLASRTIELSAGNILFTKGDRSDGLYYIVNGEFEALVDGEVVSILDNSDVFIGEMAFLLGHRRTATVIARTDAKVIFISLEEWVDTIRKYPLYGIYLSRILARKLNNTSIAVSTLKQIRI